MKEIEINQMSNGSYFIFNDFNYRDFGRDLFDNSIRSLFSESFHYYFPVENAYTHNVFNCSRNLAIIPKSYVNKSVIFEYRK